mmetsp:Transcript_22286/g.31157  ORF Transcript_22286/g.31157 Transcript_22286/m.31157 type:complete len:140 (-) Transcript_22286:422-841(-)
MGNSTHGTSCSKSGPLPPRRSISDDQTTLFHSIKHNKRLPKKFPEKIHGTRQNQAQRKKRTSREDFGMINWLPVCKSRSVHRNLVHVKFFQPSHHLSTIQEDTVTNSSRAVRDTSSQGKKKRRFSHKLTAPSLIRGPAN